MSQIEEILSRLEILEQKLFGESSTAPIEFNPYKKGILATGDTKPHKEILKKHGGKFNPTLKGWIFSKENGEKAQKALQ